jgi:hypothetical protein
MSYVSQRLAEIKVEVAERQRLEAEAAAEYLRAISVREAQKLNSPRVGFVYFIKSAGLVKIGFTCDLQQRIAAFKNSNPHELTLIGSMPGTDDTEFFLHQMFAKYRQSREWFRIEGDLDTFLSCLPDRAKARKRAVRGSRAGHRNRETSEEVIPL